MLADLAGVDTGTEMQVVYHLWSATTDGLAADRARACRATTRARRR